MRLAAVRELRGRRSCLPRSRRAVGNPPADRNGVVVLDGVGTPVARTGLAFEIDGGGLPADTDRCDVMAL